MRVAEETYLKLVGAEGYAKAIKTFEAIVNEPNPNVLEGARHLYFLQLLNAYYRGVSTGVDQAQAALRAARSKTA